MRTAKDPKGFYHTLGLAPEASADEIRTSFREAAKKYHPDQGGVEASEERFQTIREAYDTLKDPARRLAYDEGAGEPPPNGHTTRAPSGLAAFPWPLGIVASLLLVAVGVVVYLSMHIDQRDGEIEALHRRINDATNAQVAMATRLRAFNFQSLDQALSAGNGNASVFQSDILFAAGEMNLSRDSTAKLDEDLLAMIDVIDQIPAGRDWMVLIKSEVPRAADDLGVEVEPWEVGLLRLANVVEHVVNVGVPSDRVAATFSAGFSPNERNSDDLNKLELKLLCCLR